AVAVGSLVLLVNNARMDQIVMVLERTYDNTEDLYSYICKGYSQNTSTVTARNVRRFSGTPVVVIPPKYKGRVAYVSG
ncbi:MAG TPA: hypothetical protein DCS12_07095, partial [Clostridiales bacterium]|nr:hypothetical protein [Clostridiales bacterium]